MILKWCHCFSVSFLRDSAGIVELQSYCQCEGCPQRDSCRSSWLTFRQKCNLNRYRHQNQEMMNFYEIFFLLSFYKLKRVLHKCDLVIIGLKKIKWKGKQSKEKKNDENNQDSNWMKDNKLKRKWKVFQDVQILSNSSVIWWILLICNLFQRSIAQDATELKEKATNVEDSLSDVKRFFQRLQDLAEEVSVKERQMPPPRLNFLSSASRLTITTCFDY